MPPLEPEAPTTASIVNDIVNSHNIATSSIEVTPSITSSNTGRNTSPILYSDVIALILSYVPVKQYRSKKGIPIKDIRFPIHGPDANLSDLMHLACTSKLWMTNVRKMKPLQVKLRNAPIKRIPNEIEGEMRQQASLQVPYNEKQWSLAHHVARFEIDDAEEEEIGSATRWMHTLQSIDHMAERFTQLSELWLTISLAIDDKFSSPANPNTTSIFPPSLTSICVYFHPDTYYRDGDAPYHAQIAGIMQFLAQNISPASSTLELRTGFDLTWKKFPSCGLEPFRHVPSLTYMDISFPHEDCSDVLRTMHQLHRVDGIPAASYRRFICGKDAKMDDRLADPTSPPPPLREFYLTDVNRWTPLLLSNLRHSLRSLIVINRAFSIVSFGDLLVSQPYLTSLEYRPSNLMVSTDSPPNTSLREIASSAAQLQHLKIEFQDIPSEDLLFAFSKMTQLESLEICIHQWDHPFDISLLKQTPSSLTRLLLATQLAPQGDDDEVRQCTSHIAQVELLDPSDYSSRRSQRNRGPPQRDSEVDHSKKQKRENLLHAQDQSQKTSAGCGGKCAIQ